MAVTGRLELVALDARDIVAIASFYATLTGWQTDLLGMEVTYDGAEGALVTGGSNSLMFQQVSDYTPPQWPDPAHPQQGHLDVIVDDPDHLKVVGCRSQELGATRLADGATWITLADPAGHPFDLTIP